MAERFHNITADEMDRHLRKEGFSPLTIEGTVELVYGKIVRIRKHRLSLRVYTAIWPSGESRKKGSDAIRIQLYYLYDDQAWGVGKSQKCLRVKTWKRNILKAIKACEDPDNLPDCPLCGHPMAERENATTHEKFWGCVTYHKTKCTGRPLRGDNPHGWKEQGNQHRNEAAAWQPQASQAKLLEALRGVQKRWGFTHNPPGGEHEPWEWDDFHEKISGHLRECIEKIEKETLPQPTQGDQNES